MTLLKGTWRYSLRLVKFSYFTLAFLIAGMIVIKAIDYFHPDLTHGFLSGKRDVFHSWYKYALYVHIVTAPLTIFSGILQFSLSVKKKFHRLSGYVYLAAVFCAGISGFFMSFKSIGGMGSSISFGILSILWLLFTIKSFLCIKAGNIPMHKAYMTRSFILANSAILLRLFSFISNHYLGADPVNAYIVISWLSWLPGLVIYEGLHQIGKKVRYKQSNL
jgi:uncharacterized membrane protein